MHKRIQIVACSAILIIVLIAPVQLRAQTILDFKRLNLIWPTVELYFSASRDGVPITGFLKEQLTITENGVEVRDFVLHPQKPRPCPMSVALVLDASGSMSGAGNAGAKAGATAFLDRMDGTTDQAALIQFESQVKIMLGMTTDVVNLKATVQTLPALGMTTVWDGAYAGLIEVFLQGVNDCRAVIVLCDGGDGGSSRQPSEIIALANREHIRVYTIALGTSTNKVELEWIGLLTGGGFYQVNEPSMLPTVFEDIARRIKDDGFGDRAVSYLTSCPDGTVRAIELQLRDDSGNVDSRMRSMRVPLDTTQYKPQRLRLLGGTVKGGTILQVSLVTRDSLSADFPIKLRAVFPLHLPGLEFDTAFIAPGVLPGGMLVSVVKHADSAIVEMVSHARVSGGGALLDVLYRTIPVVDTLCADWDVLYCSLGIPCLQALVETSTYCILPEGSEIKIVPDAVPEFLWNAATNTYEPETAEFRFRVENTGLAVVTGATYTLSGYEQAFALVAPSTATQSGPEPQLPAMTTHSIAWRIAPLKRRSTDRVSVAMLGRFDNANPALAKTGVLIESSMPDLHCSLSAPSVQVDSSGRRFEVLNVDATVVNEGGMASDSLTVELDMSNGLELLPTVQRVQRLVPAVLPPGSNGIATWLVRVRPTASGSVESLQMQVRNGESVDAICAAHVQIPPLDTMRWINVDRIGDSVLCPGSSALLVAEEGYTSYRWNTGDTTREIVVGRGSYRVEAIDDEGIRRQSPFIPIGAHSTGYIRVNVWNREPCIGDSVHLSILPVVAGELHDVVWSTGDTSVLIRLGHTAVVYGTAVDSNGCRLVTDTVFLEFLPPPEKPHIRRTVDTLIAEVQARSIYWTRDGIPQWPEGSILVLRTPGEYVAVAVNGSTCRTSSDPYIVTTLDTDSPPAPETLAVQLWPDPAREQLFLQVQSPVSERLNITVMDVLGREMLRRSVEKGDAQLRMTLALENFPSGIYQLLLRGDHGHIVRRFRKF